MRFARVFAVILISCGSASALPIIYLADSAGLLANVDPTNGAKSAEKIAIGVRISQDGDTTSTSYNDYIGNPNHNGRRLVTVIVQSGYRDAADNLLPTSQQAVGVGFAQFLLLQDSASTLH